MNFVCKICNENKSTLLKFSSHLINQHKTSLKQYIEKYIDIPICSYCNKNHLKIPNNVINNFWKNRTFWKKTCGSKECISKLRTDIQKKIFSGQSGEIIKQKIRKKRFEYLKKKTGKTAWQRRQSREMSYLETWFFDEAINKHNLTEKYDIVNELPVYPYFIDFAFTNIKLAVELDGKHHFINDKRIQHDKNKDDYLIKNGWTVYRILYKQNNEKSINKFLDFLKNFSNNKHMENKVYKYSEIKEFFNKQKKYKKCTNCGKEILISRKFCNQCSHFLRRKVNRPSKEQLQQEVKENSFLALSKKYNVSDAAIRKWCISYGIDYKKISRFSHKKKMK